MSILRFCTFSEETLAEKTKASRPFIRKLAAMINAGDYREIKSAQRSIRFPSDKGQDIDCTFTFGPNECDRPLLCLCGEHHAISSDEGELLKDAYTRRSIMEGDRKDAELQAKQAVIIAEIESRKVVRRKVPLIYE